MATRLLKLERVAARLDVSAKTVKRWVDEGSFPAPVTLPGNMQRWLDSAVEGWIATREKHAPAKGLSRVKA